MRTLVLLIGLVSGVAVGLILAHWLGFDLMDGAASGGGAIATAAAGLGGGVGLALARRSGNGPHENKKG